MITKNYKIKQTVKNIRKKTPKLNISKSMSTLFTLFLGGVYVKMCILVYLLKYIYSFKKLFCKLSFGQRPRRCLNKSKKRFVTVMENSV